MYTDTCRYRRPVPFIFISKKEKPAFPRGLSAYSHSDILSCRDRYLSYIYIHTGMALSCRISLTRRSRAALWKARKNNLRLRHGGNYDDEVRARAAFYFYCVYICVCHNVSGYNNALRPFCLFGWLVFYLFIYTLRVYSFV